MPVHCNMLLIINKHMNDEQGMKQVLTSYYNQSFWCLLIVKTVSFREWESQPVSKTSGMPGVEYQNSEWCSSNVLRIVRRGSIDNETK